MPVNAFKQSLQEVFVSLCAQETEIHWSLSDKHLSMWNNRGGFQSKLKMLRYQNQTGKKVLQYQNNVQVNVSKQY